MVEIAAGPLATAARALMLAGRWAQAAELLTAATPAGEGEQAVLAITEAEVAIDQDFWCRARQMWERSTEQRQRTGAVPFVLSQQLLLAGLARESGDTDAARAVAEQVRRWARALGIGLLESGAAEIAGP